MFPAQRRLFSVISGDNLHLTVRKAYTVENAKQMPSGNRKVQISLGIKDAQHSFSEERRLVDKRIDGFFNDLLWV